jgi:hypothetical protein
MPMQVWPALAIPPHSAVSAALETSASGATISASLPPHSSSTGVSVSAQAAMIFFAIAVEPVKAILSTPARHSAAPVVPGPVTSCRTGCSGTTAAKVSTSHRPTAGVYSEGLNTTALPAASAYTIEPSGVKTG